MGPVYSIGKICIRDIKIKDYVLLFWFGWLPLEWISWSNDSYRFDASAGNYTRFGTADANCRSLQCSLASSFPFTECTVLSDFDMNDAAAAAAQVYRLLMFHLVCSAILCMSNDIFPFLSLLWFCTRRNIIVPSVYTHIRTYYVHAYVRILSLHFASEFLTQTNQTTVTHTRAFSCSFCHVC